MVSFAQVSPPKPCIHLSPIRVSCSTQLILHDLITRTILEEYRLLSSSLFSFVHSRLTSSQFVAEFIVGGRNHFLQGNSHRIRTRAQTLLRTMQIISCRQTELTRFGMGLFTREPCPYASGYRRYSGRGLKPATYFHLVARVPTASVV